MKKKKILKKIEILMLKSTTTEIISFPEGFNSKSEKGGGKRANKK